MQQTQEQNTPDFLTHIRHGTCWRIGASVISHPDPLKSHPIIEAQVSGIPPPPTKLIHKKRLGDIRQKTPTPYANAITPVSSEIICRRNQWVSFFFRSFLFHRIELVSKENCVGNCILAESPNGSISSIGSYGSSSCVIEPKP